MPKNDLLFFLSWSFQPGAHNQRNIYDLDNERALDGIFTRKYPSFFYLFSNLSPCAARIKRHNKSPRRFSKCKIDWRCGFIITKRRDVHTLGKYSNELRIFRFRLLCVCVSPRFHPPTDFESSPPPTETKSPFYRDTFRFLQKKAGVLF